MNIPQTLAETEWRALIVAEALSWLGTAHHHRARLKGVGVDCAQFPLGVYSNVGAIQAFDPPAYPADWHVHRDVERYLATVAPWAVEIPLAAAKPADLILCRPVRVYSHGVIVVDWPRGIHAGMHGVTLCDLEHDVELVRGPQKAFTFRRPPWD